MIHHATSETLAKHLTSVENTIAMYDPKTHSYHMFKRFMVQGEEILLKPVAPTSEVHKNFKGFKQVQQDLQIPLDVQTDKQIFVGYDNVCEEWFGFTAFNHVDTTDLSDGVAVHYRKYILEEDFKSIFECLL